jgi:hypothetical protein
MLLKEFLFLVKPSITMFVRSSLCSVIWAIWIQFPLSRHFPLRCVLIFSSCVRLNLLTEFLPSGVPIKICFVFFFRHVDTFKVFPPINLLDLLPTVTDEHFKQWIFVWRFLQLSVSYIHIFYSVFISRISPVFFVWRRIDNKQVV